MEKTWRQICLQEVYWEVLLGTSLYVSGRIKIGQREKLNFDALARGFGQSHKKLQFWNGPAELFQTKAKGQFLYPLME